MFAANRPRLACHDVVPGLVRPGLTLLAGEDQGAVSAPSVSTPSDPTITVSALAVQLAAAVAGGCRGQVLGLQANVLYLAQAENVPGLQQLLRPLRTPEGLPLSFDLYWPPLDAGGLDRLARTVAAGEGAHRLVVVDPLARAFSPLARYGPSRLLRTLEQLHVLALTHDLAIVLVDGRRRSPGAAAASSFDAALAEAGRRNLFDRTLTLVRPRGGAQAELILSDSPRPILLPNHAGALS